MRGIEVGLDFASNGKEALEKVKKGEAYNAILMNIEMPVMGGLEATRELRGLGYGGDIMAWTAHEPKQWNERCFQAGINELYALDAVSELIERIR